MSSFRKEYNRYKTLKFFGTNDIHKADDWMCSQEKIHRGIGADEDLKVELSVAHLEGAADAWYRGIVSRQGPVTDWEVFRRQFYTRFFTEAMRSRQHEEFITMTQGKGETVGDYAYRFTRCHDMAGSPLPPRRLVTRFISSLRSDISDGISGSGVTELSDAVDRAIDFETARSARTDHRGAEVNQNQSSRTSGKRSGWHGKRNFSKRFRGDRGGPPTSVSSTPAGQQLLAIEASGGSTQQTSPVPRFDQGQRQSDRGRGRGQGRGRGNRDAQNVKCWNCNRMGHYS